MPTCVEICAGAGGQALGLESAGFHPLSLVEVDPMACNTLRFNRPQWNVVEGDIKEFSGYLYKGADLLAGGVPCPPFSVAGKQLGSEDARGDGGIRTPDRVIMIHLLCRLSYIALGRKGVIRCGKTWVL